MREKKEAGEYQRFAFSAEKQFEYPEEFVAQIPCS